MKLETIQPEDLKQYKLDMQQAFQMVAVEGGFPGDEEILPESHIDRSLNTPGAIAYKAVLDTNIVEFGGILDWTGEIVTE